MAYTYKVYGTGDVDNAVNNYNRVASSAPTYADSYDTRQARQQADNYANSYTDKINKGYTSKFILKITHIKAFACAVLVFVIVHKVVIIRYAVPITLILRVIKVLQYTDSVQRIFLLLLITLVGFIF